MRKSLVIGILKENKNEWERRVPLTPSDVKWLVDKGIKVEVESSPLRVFRDEEYLESGAKLVERIDRATFLVGIKEPRVEDVLRAKIYMVFSHTAKGQSQNIPLLRKFVKNRVTLVDYEKITDIQGKRLVYFGWFAGVCGMVDSLHYLGRKLKWKGIDNPFLTMKPAWKYGSFEEIKKDMSKVGRLIRRKGFDNRIVPFIIGVTGHGNVSRGVQDALALLDPVEVHPRDMGRFIRREKHKQKEIYKIVFLREEKLRARDGKGFYFEEYLEHPDRFESNLDKHLTHLNMLIHTSYWDRRYPRMVTKDMVRTFYKRKKFRLEFIGDISCDVGGSIELTNRTSSSDRGTYTYDPKKDVYIDGYTGEGITILAVDNLPAELPKESSERFGNMTRDYVYQIAAHGVKDITNHTAIPGEIRRAVIAQGGQLTKDYQYLRKHLD